MAFRPLEDGTRRFTLLFVLPILVLLGLRIAPLALGTKTLYLRDVFHTHLEMQVAKVEGLRHGVLPLLDPYRAGGQPLAGNPNAMAFYPDNLLYLAAGTFWALNAHFWLHLLLAPFAFYFMARALGLGREGAWAAGVLYALSGYFLSLLSFYNLIAGATLAPALVAACLHLSAGRRSAPMSLVVAALWALLILSGDPFTALVALVLSAGAVAVGRDPRGSRIARPAAALAAGTLLATPQIVEFLRIVRTSYRGAAGYSKATLTLTSFHPVQAIEWLLPFVFGRPDRLGPAGFWGERFYTGRPAYFFSLYPGLLAIALVAASLALRGRTVRFAQGLVLTGLFFSLGRFNPLAGWLIEHTGGLLRYPIKFWLLVAFGGALLAGSAFEVLLDAREARAARIFFLTLLGMALVFGSGWIFFRGWPEPARSFLGPQTPLVALADLDRERWRRAALCLASVLLLALLALLAAFARRRPRAGGALLLVAHAAAQLHLLGPLMTSDRVAPYTSPPPVLAFVPATSLVVNGSSEGLFSGAGAPRADPPDDRAFWFDRRAFFDLYPFAGALWGRRYELNVSPEGLDSFLGAAARDAVRIATDLPRVRLLASWGVDRLLLERPIDREAQAEVRLLERLPGAWGPLYVYEIPGASPQVFLAARTLRAPDPQSALRLLEDASFDARSTVVVPGSGPPTGGSGGVVRIVTLDPERLSAEVNAAAPAVLVVQRAFLPLYCARVDGRPATLRIANLHRIGVDVPAGRHRVDLWIDRRPLRASIGAVVLGACSLAGLAWRLRPGAGPAGSEMGSPPAQHPPHGVYTSETPGPKGLRGGWGFWSL
jgi:hypothetical protein